MRPPAFWFAPGPTAPAILLGPLQAITARVTARRLARPGWRAPVPVVCCGNVGIGGAGKTTLTLDLALALRQRGVAVHCLTRGYGGRSVTAPLRVDVGRHDATLVGDEALLLAEVAPCWVGGDRAASARAAIADGAEILLMDDGLQNPGLVQDWPLLVIDGTVGFGNNRLLPAGPLREPVEAAAARVRYAVLVGDDRTGAGTHLPSSLVRLQADLRMDPALAALRGRRLLAFAGIARPAKFFDALAASGLTVTAMRGYPDHHRYRTHTLDRLQREADRLDALLVTTPKDAMRLPPDLRARVQVAGVTLRWRDPAARTVLLDRITRIE